MAKATARRTLEAAIESYLLRRVRELRGRTIKLYMRGWPDRLVVLPGWIGFVETKRPVGGRYEALQLRMQQVIRKLGHTSTVLRTHSEVDAFLATAVPPVPTPRKRKN